MDVQLAGGETKTGILQVTVTPSVFTTFNLRAPTRCTLTLTATDPQGATDSASVTLNVVEPPPNLAPSVRVTSPADGSFPARDEPVTLSGTATDPEGTTPLTYQWTVKLNNGSPIVVGTAPSVQWTPTSTYNFGIEGTYTIQVRLNVNDPQGNTGTDFVTLVYYIVN